MNRYIALLRAVNLGKHNRIRMGELRDALHEVGFERISTYLQSGNLVFHSALDSSNIASAVRGVISSVFKLEVSVLVRSSDDLEKIVRADPFPGGRDNLYVTFLGRELDESQVRPRVKVAGRADEFQIIGSEAFVFCHGPYHLTNLSNAFWESVSGAHATTRNWRTLTKLAEISVE